MNLELAFHWWAGKPILILKYRSIFTVWRLDSGFSRLFTNILTLLEKPLHVVTHRDKYTVAWLLFCCHLIMN
jgi:hypothetical protein